MKMNNSVIKAGVINYFYGFIQIYWLFILTSLDFKNLGMAVIMSGASILMIFCLALYSNYRSKIFNNLKAYKGVIFLGYTETIILFCLGISLWNKWVIVAVILLLGQSVFNQLKIAELKYNLLLLGESEEVDSSFIKHQLVIEIGWGLGTFLVGVLITYFQNSTEVSGNQLMGIAILLASLLSFSYAIIVKILTKDTRIKLENIKEEKKKQENPVGKFTKLIPLFLVLGVVFLTRVLFGAEDSLTSFFLKEHYTNAEGYFGAMILFACVVGILLLLYLDKKIKTLSGEEKRKFIFKIFILSCAIMVLLYEIMYFSDMNIIVLILYGLLVSGVSGIYSLTIPLVNYYKNDIDESAVIGYSEIGSSLGYIVAPYVLFYGVTEYTMGFIIPIIVGILIIILMMILNKQKV